MTIHTTRRRKLSSLLLSAAVVLGAQALLSQEAAADSVSVHVGGSAHVDAGVHVNVDGLIGALATFEAGVSVGIGFSEPPPPPPVPSYYVEYVEPEPVVYVERQPVYIDRPLAPRRAPLSRWGIGAFAGSVSADGQEDGSDLGLVGRYRLSRTWAVEAELAKTEASGGARIDRRLGGALIWNLPLGKRLKPSLIAGAGYGQSEFGAGELHARQGYGEIGLGLSYRLTKSLHITGDVRAGTRSTNEDVMYVAKGGTVQHVEENEDYSRARLGAMFFF